MTLAAILRTKAAIQPLFSKMAPAKPGDWLATHEESGQTFDEYIRSKPPRPEGQRTRIYILPIGDFTDQQMSIVKLTAEFMADGDA